ncbi:MAG: PA2779 family protein [Oleiphilaceae bacterium]|nr:PA2779 family protein [Oleiphilaceae bacterium]
MQNLSAHRRSIAFFMSLMMLFAAALPLTASAAMVGTEEMITQQQADLDRESLRAMLDNSEAKQALQSMGVTPQEVEQRINSLTPQELAQFEQQLAEGPVGEGVGGVVSVIVLFVLVFIITDMLCATNVFSFVRCVN